MCVCVCCSHKLSRIWGCSCLYVSLTSSWLLSRYTYNTGSKAVYGIALKYPSDYVLSIGAVKPAQGAKVTLLGWEQDLKWTYQAPVMNITMPFLPLNSNLRWGWTLRFDNVSPATTVTLVDGQDRAQLWHHHFKLWSIPTLLYSSSCVVQQWTFFFCQQMREVSFW